MKLKQYKKIDKTLLITVIILLALGALLIQSSSLVEALRVHGESMYFVKRHLAYIAIGLVAMLLAININYKVYKPLSFFILLISITLNLLLYTSLGEEIHGSVRWLKIGGISFMPSELLKISSVIFLATLLDNFGSKIKRRGQFYFTIATIGIITFIVFLKDMGSSMVIGGSLMFMLVASGASMFNIALVTLVVGLGSILVLKSFDRFAYRWRRIIGFRHPFSPDYDNYHLINTLYAIAMGGITGRGLGQGLQKFAHIPNVFSDSIFAVAGEELGLIGASFIVLLYLLMVYRGMIIAKESSTRYGKLLAVGLTSSLGIQGLIHIMVNVGLAPITGITLPFISYGGTSIIISMIQVGILLNISIKEDK